MQKRDYKYKRTIILFYTVIWSPSKVKKKTALNLELLSVGTVHTLFSFMRIFLPAEAEYSYISAADFRLHYSCEYRYS